VRRDHYSIDSVLSYHWLLLALEAAAAAVAAWRSAKVKCVAQNKRERGGGLKRLIKADISINGQLSKPNTS